MLIGKKLADGGVAVAAIIANGPHAGPRGQTRVPLVEGAYLPARLPWNGDLRERKFDIPVRFDHRGLEQSAKRMQDRIFERQVNALAGARQERHVASTPFISARLNA